MLNGLHISRKGESLVIHQLAYIAKHMKTSQQQIAGSADAALAEEDMPLLRKIAGCLQWAVRSAAPMHAAAVAMLQMGSEPRARSQLRQLLRVFSALQEMQPAIACPRLHKESLHLRGCSDGSCKAADRSVSAGGYLAFLAEQQGKRHLLTPKAHRIPTQCLSAAGAEAEPCARMMNQIFAMRDSIKRLISQNLPVKICAGSSSALNGVATSKSMEDPKIFLQLNAIRERHENGEMQEAHLIPGAQNPADAMTKIRHNSILPDVMKSARLANVSIKARVRSIAQE